MLPPSPELRHQPPWPPPLLRRIRCRRPSLRRSRQPPRPPPLLHHSRQPPRPTPLLHRRREPPPLPPPSVAAASRRGCDLSSILAASHRGRPLSSVVDASRRRPLPPSQPPDAAVAPSLRRSRQPPAPLPPSQPPAAATLSVTAPRPSVTGIVGRATKYELKVIQRFKSNSVFGNFYLLVANAGVPLSKENTKSYQIFVCSVLPAHCQ
nr:formin-like protein 5 isoform X1 [Lolium perenne]